MGMKLKSLRFRLRASHTKQIDMRKLFAFRVARVPEVVLLVVGGKPIRNTFIPDDFVDYKKLVFDKNEKGEVYWFGYLIRWLVN